jgi:tight adherence protein C
LKAEARPKGIARRGSLRRAARGDKLEKFAQYLEPQKAEELSALRLKLLRAGYPDKNAVHMYPRRQDGVGRSALLAIGLILCADQVGNQDEVSTQTMILYAPARGAAITCRNTGSPNAPRSARGDHLRAFPTRWT